MIREKTKYYTDIQVLGGIQIRIEMSQTQNQSKDYYSPRFRHFNIYRRDPDGDTKVDDAATQEEAKRKVYELNGWNYKPKNNTVK